MANIINIETSGKRCSVALGIEGELEDYWEETEVPSTNLPTFIQLALESLDRKGLSLDAVAISIGPGSYTGLRSGLSMAKGLCLARQAKLIAVPTLLLMAVGAMFQLRECEGTEIYIPMIDARRMEVYTAVYNARLEELVTAQPLILEPDSFIELSENVRRVFIGDGTAKFKKIATGSEDVWLSTAAPSASSMAMLAEKFFREGRFSDVAYTVPLYLKEYQAKVSVNKVLNNLHQNSKN